MKKNYFILSATLFITAGSCNNSQQQTAAETTKTIAQSSKSNETAEKKAMVKITSNGELVTEYTCSIPGAVRLKDKSGAESLMLNLNSPDNKYSLLGILAKAASGKYPLADDSKAEAQIQIYTDGSLMLARLVADKGEIEIALNGNICSGKFTGSKKGIDGKEYVISGEFSNIPLIKNDTGETY